MVVIVLLEIVNARGLRIGLGEMLLHNGIHIYCLFIGGLEGLNVQGLSTGVKNVMELSNLEHIPQCSLEN